MNNNHKGNIIYIEDDKLDQMSFSSFIEEYKLNYDYTIASSLKDAKKLLNSKHYDLALIDFKLKDGTAFDVIEKIEGVPFIILTGAGDEVIATQAMKRGAYDYIIKDLKGSYLKSLPMIIENTIKRKHMEEELKNYQNNLENMVKERTELLRKEIEEHEKIAEVTLSQEKKLQENLKEMKFFFEFWNIIDEKSLKLKEKIKKIVRLLPGVFQNPERTYAKITYEDSEFTTDFFQNTKWKLISFLIIFGEKKGQIEIYLKEDSVEIDEDLFLGIEISFLETFSKRLSDYIMHSEKENKNGSTIKELTNQIKEITKKYRYLSDSISNLYHESMNNLKKFYEDINKKNMILDQDSLLYLDNLRECNKVMWIYINNLEDYSKEIRDKVIIKKDDAIII